MSRFNKSRMSKFGNHNRFSGRNSSSKRNGSFRFGKSSRGKMRGERIDVSKFVKKSATGAATKPKIIEHVFSDFGLCQQLQRNLVSRNYLIPTPVQDQSIADIINGRDLIGLADTGTGKTAAFLLPMINKCFHIRNQKVLIVAPTRELAIQIDEEFRKFAGSLGLYSTICVGGAPIYRQISSLRRNPNFVIGTPGRLKDLKNRRVSIFRASRMSFWTKLIACLIWVLLKK